MKTSEIKEHLRDGAYIRNTFMARGEYENTLQAENHKVLGKITPEQFESLGDFIVNTSKWYTGSQNTHYKINTSPEFVEREDQIIYSYMDISGISIMCKRNGRWLCGPFKLKDVIEYINEYEGFSLNAYDMADQFKIGLRIGIHIKDIVTRCQKEFHL